jgi:hypothetical protein
LEGEVLTLDAWDLELSWSLEFGIFLVFGVWFLVLFLLVAGGREA